MVHVEGSGDRVDRRINALEAALLNALQDLEDNGIRGPGAQTSASTPSPRLEHGIGDPPWMLPTWGGPTSTENAKALPCPPHPDLLSKWWSKGWFAGCMAGWHIAWEEWMWHIQHIRAQGRWPGGWVPGGCWVPGGGAASSSFAGTGSDQAKFDAAKVAWYAEQAMHRWQQQLRRDTAWWKEHHGGAGGLQ